MTTVLRDLVSRHVAQTTQRTIAKARERWYSYNKLHGVVARVDLYTMTPVDMGYKIIHDDILITAHLTLQYVHLDVMLDMVVSVRLLVYNSTDIALPRRHSPWSTLKADRRSSNNKYTLTRRKVVHIT